MCLNDEWLDETPCPLAGFLLAALLVSVTHGVKPMNDLRPSLRIHAADVLRNIHVIVTRGRLIQMLGSRHQERLLKRKQGTVSALLPGGGGNENHEQRLSPVEAKRSTSRRESGAVGQQSTAGDRSTSGPGSTAAAEASKPHPKQQRSDASLLMWRRSKKGGGGGGGGGGGAGSSTATGATSVIDEAGPLEDLTTQDCLMLLSVYLSAIIHDFDHRGLTNPFLIQDEDPIAVSYFLMAKNYSKIISNE